MYAMPSKSEGFSTSPFIRANESRPAREAIVWCLREVDPSRDAPWLLPKLKRLLAYKKRRGEGLAAGDPLFANQSRERISKRRVQYTWRAWQVKAGFDRLYSFHSIRHTSISSVYRLSHDLFLAQRFARHVSPLTTTLYTHPSDEEMSRRVRGLPC